MSSCSAPTTLAITFSVSLDILIYMPTKVLNGHTPPNSVSGFLPESSDFPVPAVIKYGILILAESYSHPMFLAKYGYAALPVNSAL